MLRTGIGFLGLVIGFAWAEEGAAQAYPSKPLRLLTSEAGGGSDFLARVIAQGVAESLGQPVVVENHPTIIATESAAKALPDGYTAFLGASVTWLLQYMKDNVSWDPVKDFSPVTMVGTSPQILAAHPAVPVNSVKDLIALAKGKPGQLNYSSGPSGSSAHLAAELFNVMAGVNIVRVAYRGAAPQITALLSGEVQITYGSVSSVVPQSKAGKLKALAITSAQPSELLAGLPTVAASGLPGYESIIIFGIFVPANTPGAVVNRLNQDISRLLRVPEARQKILASGVETAGGSPDQLAAAVKADMGRWGKVIKDAGIRAE